MGAPLRYEALIARCTIWMAVRPLYSLHVELANEFVVQLLFNVCHMNRSLRSFFRAREVDQIMFDKTTQYIMSLTASRLRTSKLPSALIRKIEISRVEYRKAHATALLYHPGVSSLCRPPSIPNVHLLLRVLVLEQVSAAVSISNRFLQYLRDANFC